ncbi:MAG: YceI family protein [Acidimicrobiales bacterium]
MTIKSGSHSIGPENGKLTFNTYVGGVGSKAGHDLILEATRWSGTVHVDADNPSATRVEVTVDPTAFEILQATGGVKALSDKDRGDIANNSDKTLNTGKHPQITFRSTRVTGTAPRLTLAGDLTISGNTRPVDLEVSVQEAPGETRFTARTVVVQTEFGVKPYSKLGVLKVKDNVDIQVDVALPSA